MTARIDSLLDASHVTSMTGPVSIIAASCSTSCAPSMARSIGCRVSADRRRVALFFPTSQAGGLLADVSATGAVAVAFSEPATHRTLQIKGADAAVAPLEEGDLGIVAKYRQLLIEELGRLGEDPRLVRSLLACAAADLVVVNFTVAAAFSQTPGPSAGACLSAAAP